MVAIRAKLTETNALLDEKNRRLDDFCTTIAHDIRGPLAALMLKVEYILDAYDGELDSKCAGLLQRSHSSCQRLVEMVQGMYEYAKIGSRAVTFFELSLTDLVHEVLYDLSYDDSLDVQAGVGELPRVFGNPGLLRRVFLNLVNNAVKYNDKPEKLINIGCLGYEDRPIGRFARIFVEDNGPGIPEHELKGIFGMFRRGASSRKESDGLGIGLAVVERILELHFGRIDVESTPGRGTRFILSLPVERVELVT
jgi:signal transduction histidine kinase